MKNFLLCTTLFLSVYSASIFSQTQRLCLVEEFTQASCGPCAQKNPAFNAFLDVNISKVVSLKYQVNFPGSDPMYDQTKTDVDARIGTSFYWVQLAPGFRLDGQTPTGSEQGVDQLTQAEIDNDYAVPSPFLINLSFTYSPDYDSIFVACKITATMAVNMSEPARLYVALREKEIHFTSPPGSNGETVFSGVMRKLLPTAQGTVLANNWTAGTIQTINIAAPIPSYVYDLNEVDLVGFIQTGITNTSSKNVKQAAYASPVPMSVEAGIVNIDSLSVINCSSTISPVIRIKNYGSSTLTSLDVSYTIDGGTPVTKSWTGSLPTNGTASVTFSNILSTVGTHTFSCTISNPNSGTDYNVINNTKTQKFSITAPAYSNSIVEGFEGATFPPVNWIVDNPNGGKGWEDINVGGFGNSASSVRMDFYHDGQKNDVDELYVPNFDLSSVLAPQYFKFNVAYAPYDATDFDQLDVKISTDCGDSWTTLYSKSNTTLATAPAQTTIFSPTSTQWRKETIDISSYIGKNNVTIKFSGISGYGNDLYIDDINIPMAVGVNELNAIEGLNVFPNPASGMVQVSFMLNTSNHLQMKVMNSLGQVMKNIGYKNKPTGEQVLSLDVSGYPAGIYNIVLVSGNNNVITKKIIVE